MVRSPALGWGALLGLALGGFFDGILLHQILQWHHLLSLVPGKDLQGQILWDGYFHALMYVLAALSLWGLWRAHGRGAELSGRALSGALLAGFGAWHIIDSLLSHWLIGIHRIKIDSPNPLLWDLVWLVAFGLVPAVLAYGLLRRPGPPGPALSRGRRLLLVALTTAAGAWALQPPPGAASTTIVFRDSNPARVFAALDAAEARLIWTDPGMRVVVLDVAPEARWSFYSQGALLVSGTGGPAGCINWSRGR